MHSTYIVVMQWVTMAMVGSQQLSIVPKEPCFYTDCGAEDVTPSFNVNTGNPQKYRILSKIGNSIYVGGLQELIKISPDCPEGSEADPWMKRSDMIPSCTRDSGVGIMCPGLTGLTKICDNYIRIVEEVQGKLLVCGTSDAFPRCYSFSNTCDLTSDGTNLNGGACTAEESYEAHDPFNLAPRNWDHNNTLGYFGSDLFVGSSPDISVTSSFVGKLSVTGTVGDFSSGDPYTDELKTYTIEARSVNEANFVGRPYSYSRDGSDFVLLFFRETAVEHINQGKIIYSRVARVCQNDAGNADKWSSYLKARLNCSRPGEYPEDIDEIQDVVVASVGGQDYFYAVFTQPPNAPPQSALCIYSLDDIHNVFQTSQFKTATSSNPLWLPVATNMVPDPRPGFNCSAPSSDTTFLQNNPLMNDLVENFNYKTQWQISDASDYPLFFSNSARFSQIVVDSQTLAAFSDAVIFIGTESGEIWKVTDSASNSSVDIIKLWRSDDGNPITGLDVLEGDAGKKYLYATTHDRIIKIDLQFGMAQTRDQYNEIYPPYLNPLSDSEPFTVSGVLRSHQVNISICDNRQVLLLCEGILDPEFATRANAIWRFQANGTDTMVDLEDTGLGHLIQFDAPRTNVSDPLSYIIIQAHNRTSGAYQCVISTDEGDLETETSMLSVQNCITDKSVEDRRAIFKGIKMDADAATKAYEVDMTCLVEPVTCDEACPWTYP